MRLHALLLGLALVPVALAPLVLAQETAPAAVELPAARAIIDRFTTETGLAKKLAETKSFHLVGKASIPTSGNAGRFEQWMARPDSNVVHIDLPGVGEFQLGYDGKTAWSQSSLLGAQVQEGPERLQTRAQSTYDAALRPASAYESIATTARKKFAGEDTWEIRYVLPPLEGMDPDESRKYRTSYEYYSVESGRLLGMRTTSATPTGAMDAVVKYTQYARLGDVMQATVVTQEAAGNQLVVTLESLEYDKVDPRVFALPETIAAKLAADAAVPPKPVTPPDGGGGER